MIIIIIIIIIINRQGGNMDFWPKTIFLKSIFQKMYCFLMKIYENPAFHTHFIDFGGVGTNENTWKLQNKQNRFRKMRKKNRFYNKKSKLTTRFDDFGSNFVKINWILMKSNENLWESMKIQLKYMISRWF